MIRKNRPRSSSLFLMELILAILFFSIASAVCVQIFVKSHLLSQDAEALNRAVTICSNTAEELSASDDWETSIVFYDDKFAVCKEAEASYLLTTDVTQKDSMEAAHITLSDRSGTIIYELDTTRHIARRTGYEKE